MQGVNGDTAAKNMCVNVGQCLGIAIFSIVCGNCSYFK